MAVFAATDFYITIGGVDLADHIQSVELPIEVSDLDTTNFDSNGWKERIGGLKDAKVSIGFMQDFSASEVERTIYPLIGTTTAIAIRPTSAVQSSSNPTYTVSALVTDWKPISGKVGDLAMASVTWPVSGAVTMSNG
jgi:hypothetical protein